MTPADAPLDAAHFEALVQRYHDAMESFWALPEEADHELYVRDMESARAALLASHAALEERVKELEEDLANATDGFDAAMAENARLWEALDWGCNALTDSIVASGNDARTNLQWVNKMRAALRGTGEGNRG